MNKNITLAILLALGIPAAIQAQDAAPRGGSRPDAQQGEAREGRGRDGAQPQTARRPQAHNNNDRIAPLGRNPMEHYGPHAYGSRESEFHHQRPAPCHYAPPPMCHQHAYCHHHDDGPRNGLTLVIGSGR